MVREFHGDIIITKHAKNRFIQRRMNLNKRNRNPNLYIKMINMIKRSRLIKIVNRPNGKAYEYRQNDGCIFVCAREFSKNYLEKDKVIVVTVEMAEWYIKTMCLDGINIDDLDLNEYTKSRI